MTELKTINIIGQVFTLYQQTGKVINPTKTSTTHVSGGGSSSNGGHVNVTSSSTIHDQFFLMDNEGKEHSIQVSDLNVACREGHELSIIWAIRNGEKNGPYVAVYNHSTNSKFFKSSAFIATMVNPPFKAGIILALTALFFIAAIIIWQIPVIGSLIGILFIIGTLIFLQKGVFGKRKKRYERFMEELNDIRFSGLK